MTFLLVIAGKRFEKTLFCELIFDHRAVSVLDKERIDIGLRVFHTELLHDPFGGRIALDEARTGEVEIENGKAEFQKSAARLDRQPPPPKIGRQNIADLGIIFVGVQ